jgi:hypothetical protein
VYEAEDVSAGERELSGGGAVVLNLLALLALLGQMYKY